jgi:hypothetical protein
MPHWVNRKVNFMSAKSVIMQKNKATYFQWNHIIIAKRVIMRGLKGEKEKKRQKFDTILHLLQQCKPTLDLWGLYSLFSISPCCLKIIRVILLVG